MTVASLLLRHEPSWVRATRHPFLRAVADGSLAEPAFTTWLAQDYLFAADLLWFQARLLGRAPRPAQAVLGGGAVALVDELAWFERHAVARGVDLTAPPRSATVAYRRLLERLDDAEFQVALVALWALEQAYLDAWSFAAPGAPPYRDVVEHWTVPEFAAYVDGLRAVADQLADDRTPGVDAAFGEVVEAEERFWDMAYEGAGSG
jgi:formylaminopyrimidine deformylase / aminopyrimidine aminohydrolase